MAALALPVLVIVFNDTAFNVSLPSLVDRLGASETAVAWLVTVYILASTVLMPVAGHAGDALGKRRVYLLGIALFGLGSVVCAAAGSYWWLAAGRSLQGVGGSAIMPLSLALLSDNVPPPNRSRALGTWEAATPAGGVLGPVLGGVLLEWAGWAVTLGLMAVLAGVGLVLVLRYIRRAPPPAAADRPAGAAASRARPDVVGGVLLTGALVCLLFLVGGGAQSRHAAVALAAGGVAAGAAFVAWERRVPSPFLPIRMVSGRAFLFAMIGGFAMMFIGFGATIASPLYLGRVLGLTPLTLGMALIPRSGFQLISTPLGARLVGAFGHRAPAVAGMAFSALSLALTAVGAWRHSLPLVVAGLGGFGFARGLCPAAYSSAATMRLLPQDSGAGVGLYELARYSGALFGSAAFGAAIPRIRESALARGSPDATYGVVFALAAALAVLGALAGLGLPNGAGGRRRRLAASAAAACGTAGGEG
jgi:MFS family permease